MRNKRPATGWFDMPGVQKGDRTLQEQLSGLDPMLAEVSGRSVLDLGCAEGLITRTCLERGAARIHGIDYKDAFLHQAESLKLDPALVRFIRFNLNEDPDPKAMAYCQADIVLALAIIHKLRDPAKGLRAWAPFARTLFVIRLPTGSAGEFGSKYEPHSRCDTRAIMPELGFGLERDETGPRGERVHYWRRR